MGWLFTETEAGSAGEQLAEGYVDSATTGRGRGVVSPAFLLPTWGAFDASENSAEGVFDTESSHRRDQISLKRSVSRLVFPKNDQAQRRVLCLHYRHDQSIPS
jgi:hypothetical protein